MPVFKWDRFNSTWPCISRASTSLYSNSVYPSSRGSAKRKEQCSINSITEWAAAAAAAGSYCITAGEMEECHPHHQPHAAISRDGNPCGRRDLGAISGPSWSAPGEKPRPSQSRRCWGGGGNMMMESGAATPPRARRRVHVHALRLQAAFFPMTNHAAVNCTCMTRSSSHTWAYTTRANDCPLAYTARTVVVS